MNDWDFEVAADPGRVRHICWLSDSEGTGTLYIDGQRVMDEEADDV